eukprot:scaffold8415_cov127-Skeletonema_marinoi.AAC.1
MTKTWTITILYFCWKMKHLLVLIVMTITEAYFCWKPLMKHLPCVSVLGAYSLFVRIRLTKAGVPSLDNEEAAEEASIKSKSKSKSGIACGGMFPLFSDIKGDSGNESTAANSLVAKEDDDEDNNVLAIKEAPSS